jgi:hypothetical protein
LATIRALTKYKHADHFNALHDKKVTESKEDKKEDKVELDNKNAEKEVVAVKSEVKEKATTVVAHNKDAVAKKPVKKVVSKTTKVKK